MFLEYLKKKILERINCLIETTESVAVKTIHELYQLVSLSLNRRIDTNRELPLRIIPIILLLTCGAPEQKETKPIVEPVKIKGRIQIDEIKYSGPPKESWIVAGIRDTVTNDLAKVKEVEAISIDDQNKALSMIAERRKAGEKNLDPSKEAAKVLAADYLCVGNLQNTGKVLRLNIRLLKAPDFSAEQTATIDGTLDEIFTLQDKVVESLLANVDAKMKPEERLAIEVFTPKNKRAYELYAQGLEIVNTNPKKALDLFLEALKLEPDYLNALNKVGIMLYSSFDKYKDALDYFNKCKSKLEEKGLKSHEMYSAILSNIASVYKYQEMYDDALIYYFKAKQIDEELGRAKTKSYATLLNNLGGVYDSQKKYKEALEYYFKSKQIEEELRLTKTSGYATTLSNIGLLYISQQNYGEALKYLLNANIIEEENGFSKTKNHAMTLMNIGGVYDSQEKYDDALIFFIKAKKTLEDIGLVQTRMYASVLRTIGGIYKEKNSLDDALKYFFDSKKILEKLGLEKTRDYADLLGSSIGGIYYSKGDYCKSAEWARMAVNIQESIGVPSRRDNLEAAQEECNASKRR